jgi:hypothetical protein
LLLGRFSIARHKAIAKKTTTTTCPRNSSAVVRGKDIGGLTSHPYLTLRFFKSKGRAW